MDVPSQIWNSQKLENPVAVDNAADGVAGRYRLAILAGSGGLTGGSFGRSSSLLYSTNKPRKQELSSQRKGFLLRGFYRIETVCILSC
jgi:hypothetical protein